MEKISTKMELFMFDNKLKIYDMYKNNIIDNDVNFIIKEIYDNTIILEENDDGTF